jgi:hypothetical protein
MLFPRPVLKHVRAAHGFPATVLVPNKVLPEILWVALNAKALTTVTMNAAVLRIIFPFFIIKVLFNSKS